MRRHHLPQVLVIDDDADLRGLLRARLEAEGYSVLEVADGLGAFAILHTAPAPLVILVANSRRSRGRSQKER